MIFIDKNKKDIQRIVMRCAVYIFVVSLVVAVALTYLSVYHSEKTHEKYLYGEYDGLILDGALENDYNVLAQIPLFGYMVMRNRVSTSLGVVDSSATIIMALRVQEGRMPTAAGEVCLEESVKYEIADRISDNGELLLDYYDYAGDRRLISVTVVGTVANYAERQCECSFNIEGIHLPGILFFEAPVSCPHTLSLVNISEENSTDKDNVFSPNRRLEAETPVLLIVFRVFFVLSICVGIVCLFGNQWTAERSDSSVIVRLKCAGANGKYVYRRFLKRELVPICLGTVLGVLGGWGLSLAVLSIIHKSIEYYTFSFNPIMLIPFSVSVVSVLIVIRLLFLRQIIYTTPMKEWQRDSTSVVPWVRLPKRFFQKHPLSSRGIKSFLFHSEMYIVPFLCLVVVYLVITEIWIMMNTISLFYDKKLGYDYSLKTIGNLYAGYMEAAVQESFPIEEKDIIALKKTGETKTVCSSSYRRAFIAENNEEKIQIISSVFDSIDSWAETSKRGIWNSVQKEMSAFGMDGIHLWVTSLYSGNDDFLSDLTNGKLIKDNGAVFLSSDKSPYAIGDIVELTFLVYDDESGFSRRNISIRIDAVITSRSSPLTNEMKSNCFCVNNTLLSDIGCDFGYDSIYINLINSDVYKATEDIIQNISFIDKNNSLEFVSRREYNENINNTKHTVASICIIVALFSVICLGLNMFHNLTLSYARQKHSLIMLPILGMSKKQLRQYLFGEMMTMNILAIGVALLISFVLSKAGETSVTCETITKAILSLGTGMMFLTVLCTGVSVYAYNDTMIQATDWDKHKKDVRNCSTTPQVVDNPFR